MARLYSLCIFLVAATCSVVVLGMSDEKRLVKSLLETYERVGLDGRPTNFTEALTVNISFGLIELREFNIDSQEIVLVGWTALEWKDSLLVWNPDDYSGADKLSVGPENIWTPDIILTNSLSKPEAIHKSRAQVTSEGNVQLVNTYRYHFFCKIATDDIENSMFDCHMTFGSWSMDSKLLVLRPKGERFDAEYFVNNREWEFFKNKAFKEELEMPWDMKSAQVKYAFTLKRRAKREDKTDKESSAPIVTSILSLLSLCLLQSVWS